MAENDAGQHLRVQVTRVERRVWVDVARHGSANRQHSVDQLVDDLLRAIEDKSNKYAARQRAELVLALDALRAPGFAQQSVIEAFRERYGEQVAGFRYRAVWLVGPTAALTYKLG